MSKSAKTGFAVIVVIIIVIITWVWYANSKPAKQNLTPTDTTATTNTAPAASQPRTPTVADSVAGTGITPQSNLSNEDLGTDASAIDQQLSALGSDTSGVDQTLTIPATAPAYQ